MDRFIAKSLSLQSKQSCYGGRGKICGLTPAVILLLVSNFQSNVLQYLYEGSGRNPEAAGWVSGSGQQVGPGLLQAVGHLSPAQTQTWDQLAQQEPQQLQGGLENLCKEPVDVKLNTQWTFQEKLTPG